MLTGCARGSCCKVAEMVFLFAKATEKKRFLEKDVSAADKKVAEESLLLSGWGLPVR